MAEIKADSTHHHSLVVSDEQPPKPKRVASLDVFRGLTVAVLLFYSLYFPLISLFKYSPCGKVSSMLSSVCRSYNEKMIERNINMLKKSGKMVKTAQAEGTNLNLLC